MKKKNGTGGHSSPYATQKGGVIQAPHNQSANDPKPVKKTTGSDLRAGK